MDRKWRTNRAAINTVLSFPAFRDLVTPLEPTYNLATITDLYSVYTVLHIENKQWEVQWSPEGQLYYFLAKQTVAKPGEVQQAAAPEGDEDMPPPVAENDNDLEDDAPMDTRNLLDQMEAAEYSADEDAGLAKNDDEEEEEEEDDDDQEDVPQPPQPSSKNPPPLSTTEETATTVRAQLVIPVSSAHAGLTPELLRRFFAVRGVQVQQLILGLVDSNGVVTRCCLYNYIQAPLEGPGTATLELLDE